MKNILITGGAGFIGSHVVRHFVHTYPDYNIINADNLTYAGNLENLKDIEHSANYQFTQLDIRDGVWVENIVKHFEIDAIIHLAAESHVDRSISNPLIFAETNVMGTLNLLEAAKKQWGNKLKDKKFYHVSTDEVYGSLGDSELFTESTPYDPKSPYSASKAASDHFVRAYHNTYKLPIVLSNCSNNYGPNQFPEKLIPLFINNILNDRPLPVYGKGLNVRDWLYVVDHARAIDAIFHNGKVGDTYNIGGFNEWTNIDLINLLCEKMDVHLSREVGTSKKLITRIKDRAGHDFRYAIDASKLKNELDWYPSVTFEQGLSATIDWYISNKEWLNNIESGKYREYGQ